MTVMESEIVNSVTICWYCPTCDSCVGSNESSNDIYIENLLTIGGGVSRVTNCHHYIDATYKHQCNECS